jgi:arylsulfatase A-like enzyme
MGQSSRRDFLRTVGATAASVAMAGASSVAPPQEKPNFIVILCDDLGYGDVGCFGARKIRTPNIDRMATEGTKFTDFYAAAPLCTPSRAALMTGCYPRRVGLEKWVLRPDATTGLNPDEITIAEILQSRGYATACIGKWHLGFLPPFRPTRQGFDSYYGLLHNLDEYETKYFDKVGGVPILRNDDVVRRPADPAALTELYTDEALAFIAKNKARRFFLFLSHTMPHLPLGISDRFKGKSAGGLYGDVIECLDWSTGQVLDGLRRLGLDSNTIVVFTSDNGPVLKAGGSALPLRGSKNTVFEGGLRVPCVVRGPGRIAPGTVCREVATMMDLYPTFAKLAGATLPSGRVLDGRDISALMAGAAGARSPHQAFFFHDGMGQLKAVRSGQWKLHLGPSPALYDLGADVGETRNAAADLPEVVKRLSALAEAFDAELTRNARPVGKGDAAESK